MRKIKLIGEGLSVCWFASSSVFATWDGRIVQLWTNEGAEIDRFRFIKLYRIGRHPKEDIMAFGGSMIEGEKSGYLISSVGEIIGIIKPYFEWSVDGEQIIGFDKGSDKKEIVIWNYSNLRISEGKTIGLKKRVRQLSWGFDKDHAVILSEADNRAYIISLLDGKTKGDLRVKGEISQVVWSPYDNLIAIGSDVGDFRIFEITITEKGKLRKKEVFRKSFNKPVALIKWCSSNQLLLRIGLEVCLLNLSSGELVKYGEGKVFDITPDLNYLAIGYNNEVKVYGVISQEVRKRVPLNGVVKDLEFSPDGEYLAIASTDYQIRLLESSEF